ncbi:hypothetical protein GDO81_028078 [Engystomops pustulosus]|uniref:DEP domain-containing protein n=1 Tax=Engystomops pustulosus TaxID=76066 RepID=A0AAV6ZEW0_ENGPU|nr:hypothetical protein GDO81_028078 [Engystomops pustulosus]
MHILSFSSLLFRLRLHEEKIIKDRRHHLRTYPNCFVAREVIDWLIERKEASDRTIAIELMQKMIDTNIIHHVCDEFKDFKDAKLFYRFRKDDGTFPLDQEVKVFMRGQRLYEKIMNSDNSLLQAREEDGVSYERTFVASQIIDWLIQEQEAKTRSEAEQLCRRLLEHAVIQHVFGEAHFVDGNFLYQFRLNFRMRRRVWASHQETPGGGGSQDSPSSACGNRSDTSTSFLSVSPGNLVKRPFTLDELLAPFAPISGKPYGNDAVGWGFVVRGSKPCHIQAVDPSGPAASAGMKIRQFVVSVNGLNVLHCEFRAVSNLILTGPRTIVMEVMEEINP